MVAMRLFFINNKKRKKKEKSNSIWNLFIHVVEMTTIKNDLINLLPWENCKYRPEGGSFDTAGGLGAAQGSQKPLGIWCKILQSSNFQTLHSNFRKALFSITNFKDFH